MTYRINLTSPCRVIVRRSLTALSVLAVVTAPLFPVEPSYQFTPIPGLVAIAENGTMLTSDGICRKGECEAISLPGPGGGLDINSNGTVVGVYVFADGGVPECPVTSGFIRDRNGDLSYIGTELYRINESGVALGSLAGCGFGFYIVVTDGKSEPLWEFDRLLFTQPGFALPLSINDSGVILGEYYDGSSYRYALSDGETLRFLETPDPSGDGKARFYDLNNRGQTVGSWEEPTSYYLPYEARFRFRGFLRQPDGDILPIDWLYPWPDSIVRRLYEGSEEIQLHLIEPLGTQLLRINDRGDIVAKSWAYYRGQAPNGMMVDYVERVNGIASQH